MITVHMHDPQDRKAFRPKEGEVLCDMVACQPTPPPGELTAKQVPQYGPDWIAFAMAGGEIRQGNTLLVPAEETIND